MCAGGTLRHVYVYLSSQRRSITHSHAALIYLMISFKVQYDLEYQLIVSTKIDRAKDKKDKKKKDDSQDG